MKKNLFILGMASVFALTGCHGTKKVEFKEFGEEVAKLSEQKFEVEKVKVSGKYEGESFKAFTIELKSEKEPELDDTQKKAYFVAEASASVVAVYTAISMGYAVVGEEAVKGMTFYVGNGFKIKSEKDGEKSSAEYDKRGLLVSLKTSKDKKATNISLKWTVEEKK